MYTMRFLPVVLESRTFCSLMRMNYLLAQVMDIYGSSHTKLSLIGEILAGYYYLIISRGAGGPGQDI